MTTITDDMLMALADGELDGAEAARVKAEIAKNPELAATYEVFAETARLLREDYALGPTPPALIAAIDAIAPPAKASAEGPRAASVPPPANILPPPKRHPSAKVFAFPQRGFGWGAIAAGLALAFLAGGYLMPRGAGGYDPAEFAALPTGEVARSASGAEVRALASFDSDQGLCRTLSATSTSETRRDVICQSLTGWDVALSLTAPSSEGRVYLPANDALTQSLDGFLDAIGAGPALSATDEAARLKTR